MADFSLRQGEDRIVNLVVSGNGTHIDISGASKIMAQLLIDNEVVKNYSLTPETDYGTLEIDSTHNYQVNLFIERNQSKSFNTGIMVVALLVEFVDMTFPNGTRTQEFIFRIGRVLCGKGIDLNL